MLRMRLRQMRRHLLARALLTSSGRTSGSRWNSLAKLPSMCICTQVRRTTASNHPSRYHNPQKPIALSPCCVRSLSRALSCPYQRPAECTSAFFCLPTRKRARATRPRRLSRARSPSLRSRRPRRSRRKKRRNPKRRSRPQRVRNRPFVALCFSQPEVTLLWRSASPHALWAIRSCCAAAP